MARQKAPASTSLPRAAIIIGAPLLVACLLAPLYSDPRVVWVIRLLFGGCGVLCVLLGLLALWQERLRSRVLDDADE